MESLQPRDDSSSSSSSEYEDEDRQMPVPASDNFRGVGIDKENF